MKKVVKELTKQVGEHPEYDSSAIYVYEEANKYKTLWRLQENYESGNFCFYCMNTSCGTLNGEHNSFEELLSDAQEEGSCVNGTCYKLATQEDLARFIMGCREFEKIEKKSDTVSDEILVEDCIDYKIYAYKSQYCGVLKLSLNGDKCGGFYSVDNSVVHSDVYNNYGKTTVKSAVLKEVNRGEVVYQFDNQNEFAEWILKVS